MTMVCPACRNNVEVNAAGNCPHCDRPLMSRSEDTMPGTHPPTDRHAPAASVIATEDAELLQHAGVRAPSQLGSLGRIGKFEIVKAIGQGGMARVYLATEPVTGTSVALKMLHEELAQDPRVVKRFLAEARHMYELSHPNILKVLEVSGPEDGVFFVMPLARGDSLDQKIGPNGMSEEDILDICTQVAEGLTYAHSKGLLHRDLKPANILLDGEGRAMIADFGLVRPFFNDTMIDVTKTRPEGTPAYMSPRVAAGQAEDTRADIYAFGALMYEMITGHPPYTGRDPMAVLDAIIAAPPEPLASAKPEASAGLVAITEFCMARELRDRYASMSDVLDDLNKLKTGQAPRGSHGQHDGALTARAPGKALPRFLIGATAIILLGIAGLYGAHYWSSRQGQNEPKQLLTANALLADGDYEAAATHYKDILSRDASHAGALFGMGKTLYAKRQFVEGTDYLRRAHDADQGNAEVNRMLVTHLLEIGHTIPARRVIERWLQADLDNAEALKLQEKLGKSTDNPESEDEWRPPHRRRPERQDRGPDSDPMRPHEQRRNEGDPFGGPPPEDRRMPPPL